MRRTSVLIGTAAATAVYVLFNMVPVSGSETVTSYGVQSQVPVMTTLHLPLIWLLAFIVVWYFLNWIQVVNQWNRRPVMRFGSYIRTLGPGISFIEPITTDVLHDISIQDQVIEVEVKSLQTKDNVPISFVGILTYNIAENKVKDSVVNVQDVDDALHQRTLTTLTDVTASMDLNNLLEHREGFSTTVVTKLSDRVKTWGPNILALELRDFKVNDPQIEQALALKARAEKEGQAELTRAELQHKVALALNIAAAAYSTAGWRLKNLEVLLELGRSGENNTIMLPTELTDMLATAGNWFKGLPPTAAPASLPAPEGAAPATPPTQQA